MKVLLVYPKYPDTYWSFSHALRFISKKAAYPPLGLITVAALLPEKWDKKLVDLNIESLNDKDLEWADYVLISAMSVFAGSIKAIVVPSNCIGLVCRLHLFVFPPIVQKHGFQVSSGVFHV